MRWVNAVTALGSTEKKVSLSINEQIISKYIGEDIKDKNGELIIGAGFDITEEQLEKIIDQGINSLNIVNIDPINKGPYLLETLKIDKNTNKAEALNDIYKVLRPGEAPSVEIAEEIFNNLYFNRYDICYDLLYYFKT